jgi:hypothetical protein
MKKTKKTLSYKWLAVLVVLAVLPLTHAQIPMLMNYQGYLTDSEQEPLTGGFEVLFQIYDDSTSGHLLWSEMHGKVAVENGLFSVVLGNEGSPLTESVFESPLTWLAIEVNGRSIEPRSQITSVGYAHRVSTVDGASGGTVTGNVEVIGDSRVQSGDFTVVGNAQVAGQLNADGNLTAGGAMNASSGSTSGNFSVGNDLNVTGQLAPNGGIVTSGGITIQSLGNNVLIIAGTSQITVDPTGGVTIQSNLVQINAADNLLLTAANTLSIDAADVTIHGSNNLNLSARDVFVDADRDLGLSAAQTASIDADDAVINASYNLGLTAAQTASINADDAVINAGNNLDLSGTSNVSVEAGLNLTLDAGITASLDGGSALNLDSPATDVNGAATLILTGGLVTIN